jgi:capsule polysaccharide modification protein KpsS
LIAEIGNKYKNVTVIEAGSDVDSYTLCEMADKVITFNSTMGVESVYWGTPVILIGRAYYEGLKCFYKPKDHEEVITLIKSNLEVKNKTESLKYGYWQLRLGTEYRYYKSSGVTSGFYRNVIIKPYWIWDFIMKINSKFSSLMKFISNLN